jgi:SAM-dependent methyltransferase
MGNLFFVKKKAEYRKMLLGMNLEPYYTHGYEFLKALGFGETLRIDLNGLNHAIDVDLSSIIDDHRLNGKQVDLIIDSGTGEHIPNQYNYFHNVNRLCKVGGICVFNLPLKDTWTNHGFYKYEAKFFEILAEKLQYEILYNKVIARENKEYKKNIVFSMRKTCDVDFIGLKDFCEINGLHEQGQPVPKTYEDNMEHVKWFINYRKEV